MAFFKEFKEFAARGNVIDLAVAVVMGTAFGAITKSLVNDIIMPVVGLLVSDTDFSKLVVTLRTATADKAAVTLNYGLLINAVVNFIIIALAMFLLVKGINSLKRRLEEPPKEQEPAAPPPEQQLLTEIRDILKAQAR